MKSQKESAVKPTPSLGVVSRTEMKIFTMTRRVVINRENLIRFMHYIIMISIFLTWQGRSEEG